MRERVIEKGQLRLGKKGRKKERERGNLEILELKQKTKKRDIAPKKVRD